MSVSSFYRTTVGKKVAMAATGAVLILFVLGHMIGNLKLFQGFDQTHGGYKVDIYAQFLREMGYPMFSHGQALWLVRIVLLVCVVIHALAAYSLTITNYRARPVVYVKKESLAASVASLTMRVSGVLLFFFIIYHILHFTTGTLHFQGFREGHVFDNLVAAFHVRWVAILYVAAMTALGFHLYHGAWSMCQTLGLCNDSNERCVRFSAKILALIISLGFMLVPVAIYSGVIGKRPVVISGGSE